MASWKAGIMSLLFGWRAIVASLAIILFAALQLESRGNPAQQGLYLSSRYLSGDFKYDGFYYETATGRISLPVQLKSNTQGKKSEWQAKTRDSRVASILILPEGDNYTVRFSAQPAMALSNGGFTSMPGKRSISPA